MCIRVVHVHMQQSSACTRERASERERVGAQDQHEIQMKQKRKTTQVPIQKKYTILKMHACIWIWIQSRFPPVSFTHLAFVSKCTLFPMQWFVCYFLLQPLLLLPLLLFSMPCIMYRFFGVLLTLDLVRLTAGAICTLKIVLCDCFTVVAARTLQFELWKNACILSSFVLLWIKMCVGLLQPSNKNSQRIYFPLA